MQGVNVRITTDNIHLEGSQEGLKQMRGAVDQILLQFMGRPCYTEYTAIRYFTQLYIPVYRQSSDDVSFAIRWMQSVGILKIYELKHERKAVVLIFVR